MAFTTLQKLLGSINRQILEGRRRKRDQADKNRSRARLRLEALEDRMVPAFFVPGTIQGQDGWSGGTIPIAVQVVQGVDQTGANSHSGVGAWSVSNNTSLGGYNGPFSGWAFGPGLAVSAGQPSSGAGADRFSATYFFKSASSVADGSNIEVDLGTASGDDRNTFLAITNRADGDGGLQIRMAESDVAAPGFFFPTQIVATNLSRGTWHRIDILATFVNGTSNDTFQVSLDGGAPITNTTPASPRTGTPDWGTFEGYRDGNSFPYALSNRLYFRSGAAPSAFGAFSNTGAAGIYFDDVSYKVWHSAAPATILASNAATFEPAGATANPVYVNDNWSGTPVGVDPDGAGPATAFGYDAFSTVQDGVNGVTASGTVNVLAGTYHEDVTVGKTLDLLGAGYAATTISGAIGGSASTILVGASNVTIAGVTITRDGNNTTDWNNPGLNSAGISVQGLAITGMLVHDNLFTGNRTGIDVNNSNGHTIRNNVITDNRTGLIFRNQTDNMTVVENAITDNWTVGVLLLDASGGTNSPVQSAANSTFSNNDISGNWYGQVVDRQAGGALPAPGTTNLKNFTGNWFGTSASVVTTANSTEPGYAAQIPVAFGGTAVAPGGQPDIAGAASANIIISPYLTTGVDTDTETTPGRGTFGFQGDFDFTSATSLIYKGANGVSLVVNQTTGEYLFVDSDSTSYTGDGARVQKKVLKIHDQSSNGKIDVTGDVNGAITVSLKGNGNPTLFALTRFNL